MPPFLVGTYLLTKGHRDDLSPESAPARPKGQGRGLAPAERPADPVPPLPVATPAKAPAVQTREWIEAQLAGKPDSSDKVDGPSPYWQPAPRPLYDPERSPVDAVLHPDYGAFDRPPPGTAPAARPTVAEQLVKALSDPSKDDGPSGSKVDWDFIKKNETRQGVQGLEALVPTRGGAVIDKSGVTVAHGFDLGGRSAESLRQAGVDQALVDKLAPYLPYRGQPAKQFLDRHPLTLSADEARALDGVARRENLDRLARAFDRSSSVGRFHDLPAKTQTAIADVFFQYGTHDPASAAPTFWRQVTTGQWDAAQRNLMNFGDKYHSRRLRDAGLMLEDVRSGRLRPSPLGG